MHDFIKGSHNNLKKNNVISEDYFYWPKMHLEKKGQTFRQGASPAPLVDRPTQLYYIWIFICCNYTNLRNLSTAQKKFVRDNFLTFIVTCKATLPDQNFNQKYIKGIEGYFCKKKNHANLNFPQQEMNPGMLHRGITRKNHLRYFVRLICKILFISQEPDYITRWNFKRRNKWIKKSMKLLTSL